MEEVGRIEKSFVERLIEEQMEKKKRVKGIVVKEVEGESEEMIKRDSRYFEYQKHGDVRGEKRPTENK